VRRHAAAKELNRLGGGDEGVVEGEDELACGAWGGCCEVGGRCW
jgi:hypothetical protein